MAFGLARWRLHDLSQKIQMSHQALYTSLTFIFVGGYLILVGIVAEIIKDTGWAVGEAFGALFIFVTSIALVIVGGVASGSCRSFNNLCRVIFFAPSMIIGKNGWKSRRHFLPALIINTFGIVTWNGWDGPLVPPELRIWKKFEVDGRISSDSNGEFRRSASADGWHACLGSTQCW